MIGNFDNFPGKMLSQDSCPALAAHRLSLKTSRCGLLSRVSSWTYPDTLGSFFGVSSSPNKGGQVHVILFQQEVLLVNYFKLFLETCSALGVCRAVAG